MPAKKSQGTQVAVIGTEHTLVSAATEEVVAVLVVDTTLMAGGDTVELRIKTRARDDGATVQAYLGTFSGAQTTPIKISEPVPVIGSSDYTLKQTAGTGRSFPWRLEYI